MKDAPTQVPLRPNQGADSCPPQMKKWQSISLRMTVQILAIWNWKSAWFLKAAKALVQPC